MLPKSIAAQHERWWLCFITFQKFVMLFPAPAPDALPGRVNGSHLATTGTLGTPEDSSLLLCKILNISWDVEALGTNPAMSHKRDIGRGGRLCIVSSLVLWPLPLPSSKLPWVGVGCWESTPGLSLGFSCYLTMRGLPTSSISF